MEKQTARKRNHILIALFIMAFTAALTFGVLVLFRNHNQKGYVFKINSAAKSFYNTVNSYFTEHTDPPEDGLYTAEYRPDTRQLVLKNTATNAPYVITDVPDLSTSGKRMFFLAEIKDGIAEKTCACRSNILKPEDIEKKQRETTPYNLTLAEYYLNRFIGQYP